MGANYKCTSRNVKGECCKAELTVQWLASALQQGMPAIRRYRGTLPWGSSELTSSSAACRKGFNEITLECLRVLSRHRLAAMLWQLLILLGLRLPNPLTIDQTEQMRIVFDGKAFSLTPALLADLTAQAFHQTLPDKQPANGDATSPKVEAATVHNYNDCDLCKDMEVGTYC